MVSVSGSPAQSITTTDARKLAKYTDQFLYVTNISIAKPRTIPKICIKITSLLPF